MAKAPAWPSTIDEATVERLIPTGQQAVAHTAVAAQDHDATEPVQLHASNVANVLLMALATLLEPEPDCATPRGIRLTGEMVGKELAELIRDLRRLKLADQAEPSRVQ